MIVEVEAVEVAVAKNMARARRTMAWGEAQWHWDSKSKKSGIRKELRDPLVLSFSRLIFHSVQSTPRSSPAQTTTGLRLQTIRKGSKEGHGARAPSALTAH